MAFDELPPSTTIVRATEQYRQGMKNLGRALLALASVQVAFLLLVTGQIAPELLALMGLAIAVHLTLGILIFREHFWANYVAIVWAATAIVLNLIQIGKEAGMEPEGSPIGSCIGMLIMGALIYYAQANLQAYWTMKKSKREF